MDESSPSQSVQQLPNGSNPTIPHKQDCLNFQSLALELNTTFSWDLFPCNPSLTKELFDKIVDHLDFRGLLALIRVCKFLYYNFRVKDMGSSSFFFTKYQTHINLGFVPTMSVTNPGLHLNVHLSSSCGLTIPKWLYIDTFIEKSQTSFLSTDVRLMVIHRGKAKRGEKSIIPDSLRSILDGAFSKLVQLPGLSCKHFEEKEKESKILMDFLTPFLGHTFPNLNHLVFDCVPIDKFLLKPIEKLHLDVLRMDFCAFKFGYDYVVLREFNIKNLCLTIHNNQLYKFILPNKLEGLVVHGIPEPMKTRSFRFELSASNCESLQHV
jgi:hypothetical protein